MLRDTGEKRQFSRSTHKLKGNDAELGINIWIGINRLGVASRFRLKKVWFV